METTDRWASHRWDRTLDDEFVRIFLSLQWAQDRSITEARPLFIKHGLSGAEFDVLATLRNAEPPYRLTPKELQDHVVLTSGGLTKIMMQLEARGWVKRSLDETDQRVKPVQLTAAGKRIIEKAMADVVAAGGASLRARLSAGEIRTLTKLLEKLLAS